MTIDSAKFRGIYSQLTDSFAEREGAIEAVLLALLSGQHALLVGPPGTAKSALFFAVLSHLTDARKFQTLVTKFSTEDEMFGPVKLSALKEDRWERALEGRLGAVECAFLDEVFKGSDSVLNTLLSAMNERLYKGAPIPLRYVVAASNELPEGESLAAIYDRFLLREEVAYIEGEDAWMSLMAGTPAYVPEETISLADLAEAVRAVRAVSLPQSVIRGMLAVKKACAAAGIIASDRRWVSLTNVLRAAAWLAGRDEVELDDLRVLRFGLWNRPEERAQVIEILKKVDQGPAARAVAIIDVALKQFNTRPSEPAARRAAAGAIATALQSATVQVDAIIAAGISRSALQRIGRGREELVDAFQVVTQETRAGFGGLSSLRARSTAGAS